MNLASTVLLGAIAGFTIYLGLPVGRLGQPRPRLQAFLNALATGILVFLLWDVLTKASEPIDTALDAAKKGNPTEFIVLVCIFAVGLGAGLLSLVYFEGAVIHRGAPGAICGNTGILSSGEKGRFLAAGLRGPDQAAAASSSGATSQPVSPGVTMSAGPNRATAIAGSSHAIPSTSTSPNCSQTDASTLASAAE